MFFSLEGETVASLTPYPFIPLSLYPPYPLIPLSLYPPLSPYPFIPLSPYLLIKSPFSVARGV